MKAFCTSVILTKKQRELLIGLLTDAEPGTVQIIITTIDACEMAVGAPFAGPAGRVPLAEDQASLVEGINEGKS